MTNRVRDIIADTGGILQGNYFIAMKEKGMACDTYVNMDPTFTHTTQTASICSALVSLWDGYDVIAGPALGGAILAHTAAQIAGKKAVWADKKQNGTFVLERMGFAQAVRGKRVLAIDDIGSSGRSLKAAINLIRKAGGKFVGASFVWNRGGITAEDLGVPKLQSLVDEVIPSFRLESHPQYGVWPLVTDVGHPEYVPNYPGPWTRLLAA